MAMYTVQQGDTYKQIAMVYTIGGAGYEDAVSYQAGHRGDIIAVPGQRFEIPDSWLKPTWQGQAELPPPMMLTISGGQTPQKAAPGTSTKQWGTYMLYAAGAVVLLMLLMDSGGGPKE